MNEKGEIRYLVQTRLLFFIWLDGKSFESRHKAQLSIDKKLGPT
jgi:hypothetical protein